jgi:two-component system, chemotaxis family, protein-glutamate methylesterase/glutaminase
MSSARKTPKIRVLVVDDSRVMNAQIKKILESDPDMEVIGQASDGLEALELVEELKPDVVTLDVEMPRMSGLTALKHIMVKYPVPTVMISALTKEGAQATYDAFRYGAADVIAKPSRRHDVSLEGQEADIVGKVKRASQIRIDAARRLVLPALDGLEVPKGKGSPGAKTRFVAIGAGMGSYYSLLRIIPRLSAEFQDVVACVILTAERYTRPFVDYLAANAAVPVLPFEPGTAFESGACYIASGERRPVLARSAPNILFPEMRFAGVEESGLGPIDALFISLAELVGNRGVGVVLSGPGKDGADGIAAIRKAGGIGVIQEITNCMNPSMPLAVLAKGSVEKMAPDHAIAEFLLNLE